MCNLFNTFFGGCASQASTIGSCGRCGRCGRSDRCGSSGWTCNYQRVCRDGHGNIVIVGNQYCQNAFANVANDYDDDCCVTRQSCTPASNNCGFGRCRTQGSCFYNCNN